MVIAYVDEWAGEGGLKFENMVNFRVIAIRTGDKLESYPKEKDNERETGVVLNPLKVLKPNTIYSLHNFYEFPNNDFSLIKYYANRDVDLYEIKNSKKNIPVNINAIVGKNGSGKSTLIELLYWANYNIGCNLKLLEFETGEMPEAYKFLNFDLLYTINGNEHFVLKFKDGKIIKQKYSLKSNEIVLKGKEVHVKRSKDLKDFFYSVVINYSHYALNSSEIGLWVKTLFHKNDAYQTPIVLNPMRNNGTIEINKERFLLSRRLVSNLLEYVEPGKEKDSLRNIANGKIAQNLKVSYSPNPFSNYHYPFEFTKYPDLINSLNEVFGMQITYTNLDNWYYNVSFNYIAQKVEKIIRVYKSYHRFKSDDYKIAFKDFFSEIKKSNSHITFKLKSTILYLKYYDTLYENQVIAIDKPFILSVDNLSSKAVEIKNKEEENFWVNSFMMVPPPFFYIDVVLENGLTVEGLSSGEKQKIHSINSIIYHLINLNSVEERKLKDGSQQVSFQYINVILDEIELYYHPEWQRRYVSDLIQSLSRVGHDNLKNILGLNFTFLTHSPFILSDIPSTNVLYLEEDGSIYGNAYKVKTFGANIHDLLRHSFFLNDSSMGAYAVERINDTINYLNYKILEKDIKKREKEKADKEIIRQKNEVIKELKPLVNDKEDKEKHLALLKIIDEPILKRKLMELYDEAFGGDNEIELINQRINELESRKAEIQKLKK